MPNFHAFYSRYEPFFKRSCEIASNDTDAADAFVPAVPENWDSNGILFYGSASYGWDGGDEFEKSAESTLKILQDKRYQNSRFWQLAYGLQDILNGPLVWSNLHKIGSKSGEPHTALRKAQMQLNHDTFQYECETLKPGLIVFATGELANDTVPYVLNENDWQKWHRVDERLAWARQDLNIPTIWLTRRRTITIASIVDAAEKAAAYTYNEIGASS